MFWQKVLADDRHAEFDEKNLLIVFCLSCGEWITMRLLYNFQRWKEHRASSKCWCNAARGFASRSLFSLGFSRTTSSLASRDHGTQPLPCPGLSRLSDRRIDRYMSRTSATGGGSPTRMEIARGLWQLEKDVHWGDLSAKRQRLVLRQEEIQQVWRISQANQAVYASNCMPIVHTSTSTEDRACEACRSLYAVHTFHVAIQRPMPEEKNFKFTPKAYRSPELGDIYLKYKGVRDLVEKVCDICLIIYLCLYGTHRMMDVHLGSSLLKAFSKVLSSWIRCLAWWRLWLSTPIVLAKAKVSKI